MWRLTSKKKHGTLWLSGTLWLNLRNLVALDMLQLACMLNLFNKYMSNHDLIMGMNRWELA
jgi:hypothetical protein